MGSSEIVPTDGIDSEPDDAGHEHDEESDFHVQPAAEDYGIFLVV